MAHEELKKQYEEDRKNYDRPWELWEMASIKKDDWEPLDTRPLWFPNLRYRRKEPPFQPEYYSGLNWRDALPLIGEVVEFSDCGQKWTEPRILTKIYTGDYRSHRYVNMVNGSEFGNVYIRTCPQTRSHPTITIGGVELPRPEVEAPKCGTHFYTWSPNTHFVLHVWDGYEDDIEWLVKGMIHLNESRAQAWADWWENTVMAAIKEVR